MSTQHDKAPPSGLRSTLRPAFGTMVAASAAPYGYTVSVWSTGGLLMHYHGTPRTHDVFAFAAGALAGFALLGVLAHGAISHGDQLDHGPDRVLTGMLHWFAVGAAIGAAALLAELHGWAAWPLASFAATAVYLLGASLQLAVVAARTQRRTSASRR
ncbi:MAG TPA: hypothetical protein VH300_15460 [Thermoleophilaceae bacterium]|jgi:hypothetical protein|nr:hypothetical protein [Thermoleophilaceae bacterium]